MDSDTDSEMEIYLVGGAVRDQLLGRSIKEKDYVVVGATEQEMRELGYRSVGKDFPVFLHPDTNEEYALARTERKIGPGHQGFECHASPEVTLEEDLLRRDLTINAIAQDTDGNLIDPFDGQQDIENQILKHVSEAFREDPLRILRVARFQATFPDFDVHADTTALMKQMIISGSLQELTPERVLLELDKALKAPAPALFFHCLTNLGADQILWPDLTEQAVRQLDQVSSEDPETRFAALFSQLPEDELLSFCTKYKCSNQRREVTQLIIRHLATWENLPSLSAEQIVELFTATDAFRKQARFIEFDRICRELTKQKELNWIQILEKASAIGASDVGEELTGPDLGAAIQRKRVEAVAELIA